METCIYANGWRTVETADKQRALNICGNQESAISISSDQWKVIIQHLVDQVWIPIPSLPEFWYVKDVCKKPDCQPVNV